MEVAIIGAGFTGLSAAYRLNEKGIKVDVFEADSRPGGLAMGFREPNWEWSLEAHYHHWFTSDLAVRSLASEIGHKIIFTRPKTSTLMGSEINQLDSPVSLLKFTNLSLIDRIRTGMILGYLRLTPYWKNLEKITSREFLGKWMGESSWKILWQPLSIKKFGNYYKDIPASWFWARISKRSSSLGYPEGGFQVFADHIAQVFESHGGRIFYKSPVKKISRSGRKINLTLFEKELAYDAVICTLPSPLFLKITPGLDTDYAGCLANLKGLGAVNLVLSLKKSFLKDGTYWLNINNLDYPFLAIVEHTNFMDAANYNNERLVYVGNYLDSRHKYMNASADQLFKEFFPYLRQINPDFDRTWLNRMYLFKTPFAQPVVPLHYSKLLPSLKTPIRGLYLANMQQVYPWDRGTNYAVELGEKVVKLVLKSSK